MYVAPPVVVVPYGQPFALVSCVSSLPGCAFTQISPLPDVVCYFMLLSVFFTYRQWGQSTSYNVPHPVRGLKTSIHPSPVHAYDFLSRFRYNTSTLRQRMVELSYSLPHAFRYGNQKKNSLLLRPLITSTL